MNQPKAFRKKPVSIIAIIWTGDNFDAVKAFAGDNAHLKDGQLIIGTLEDGEGEVKAEHVATVGDYVIRGVEGEFYFCKPHIFLKTYEEDT